jgi:sacsin
VYNWTDSPSIISRERFLIFDPHCERVNGSAYDFVRNSSYVEIQNHMSAFRAVMEHFDKPLDGTIIRIPLRTDDQAKRSQISVSGRGTTVSEVREVLQNFAEEFGNNGLLFMRNVEKLEIRSNDRISVHIEMNSDGNLRLYVYLVSE